MTAYPEIIWVYIENLTVELAQIRVGRLDAVQVIHSLVQRIQHNFAMDSHIRVPQDSSYTVQISKFAEIALSPWIDDQYSVANKKHRIMEPCVIYIKLFLSCNGFCLEIPVNCRLISLLVLPKELYLARA